MRKKIPADCRQLVLHEAGYRCANPTCRTILTLDIHHLEYVSDDGGNDPANLLPLCPNCHGLHHSGVIPRESIRAWTVSYTHLDVYKRQVEALLDPPEQIQQNGNDGFVVELHQVLGFKA